MPISFHLLYTEAMVLANEKEDDVARALCTVDGRPASTEAVRAAIDFCRTEGADLSLVGVVRPLAAAVQPARGELTRRFNEVQYGLVFAARAAREAGLEPEIVIRSGDPQEELLREADRVGAEDLFAAAKPAWLTALLKRRAVRVEHLTLPGPGPRVVELKRAA
jgi:nucleotide-binding universal stress UspA family protein